MSEQEPVKPIDSSIKSWQAILDFLKSAIVAGLLILFLVYPDGIWFVLNRAGLNLKELSIFGAKLEREAAETAVDLTTALRDANLTNQILKTDLSAAKESLEKVNGCFSSLERLQACANDNNLRVQFEQRQQEAARSVATAQRSAGAIESTLAANREVIERSAASIAPRTSLWGVVFGGDVSKEAAENEIKRAQRLRVANLGIYSRQRSFRSVAEFDSQEAAMSAAIRLRQINAGAYVVELGRWCPGATRTEGSNGYTFIECQSP